MGNNLPKFRKTKKPKTTLKVIKFRDDPLPDPDLPTDANLKEYYNSYMEDYFCKLTSDKVVDMAILKEELPIKPGRGLDLAHRILDIKNNLKTDLVNNRKQKKSKGTFKRKLFLSIL